MVHGDVIDEGMTLRQLHKGRGPLDAPPVPEGFGLALLPAPTLLPRVQLYLVQLLALIVDDVSLLPLVVRYNHWVLRDVEQQLVVLVFWLCLQVWKARLACLHALPIT